MVITTSAPGTAPAGDVAADAPWSTSGSVLLLVRFQTVAGREKPAGHRRTHLSEAEECELCHGDLHLSRLG